MNGTVCQNHTPLPSRFPTSLPSLTSQRLSFTFIIYLGQGSANHAFRTTVQIWTTASLILLLLYTWSVPPDSDLNRHAKFWWLARTICPGIFLNWIPPPIWAFVFVVHLGEGAYTANLAHKHHMPWHIVVSCPSFCNGLLRTAAVADIR